VRFLTLPGLLEGLQDVLLHPRGSAPHQGEESQYMVQCWSELIPFSSCSEYEECFQDFEEVLIVSGMIAS